MKKLLLFLTFLLTSVFVYSQITFERHYGGAGADNGGGNVRQTIDGGYIITGQTDSYGVGGTDIYLIKTNLYGDTLWTKTIGGLGDERAFSLNSTNDSGYIISGETSSFGAGNGDAYAIKLNQNGDTLWTRTYGGLSDDMSWDMIQTNDSGYISVGGTMSFGSVSMSVYLVKTDKNGFLEWSNTYSKKNGNIGYGVIQTSDNGYLIAGGAFNTSVNSRDCYVIKTNAIGDTLWTKLIGGLSDDMAYSLCKTNDNNFVICGYTSSSGFGGDDILLCKLNTSGVVLWTKTYGGPLDEWGTAHLTTDSGFIISGYTQSFGAGNDDAYIIKTNNNGDTLWTRTYGGNGNESAGVGQETSDGGFILAGYTNSYGGDNDVYLIKTDANGHFAGIDNYVSAKDTRINVFPNPTAGQLSIQIPKQFGQTKTLEIFDIIGQLKLTKTDSFSDNDISSLTSGLYFIVVTNTDNERQTMKIIKD